MSVFRIFINLFLLSLLRFTVNAQNPTYIAHVCRNAVNFTRNRTYQSNLNSLLSALSSNANVTNGFYNTTSGESPNRIYGFFLCRGDVPTTICQNCVIFATKNVENWCPVEKQVVIWYDECLLHYSGEPNSFTLSERLNASTVNPTNLNASYEGQFNKEVAVTINDATTQAVSVDKRFATKKSNCSVFQTLYSLVQCTPDLSSLDCNRCLQEAISGLSECCSGKVGARVLYPRCYVRYEVYQFYAAPILTPPAVVNHRGKVECIIY
ncbi:hypothetical protein SLE2022_392680 [Rubroshorea leprosula]|uniref:Gnk2-homologous domain-containing protein n=1 Tax=Rubroshorea leprosula TaxID=152421 RepID=A0AAV5K6F5_9ROSI|nr:hypothetical protein SLEP1_g29625 [Rubroshorea leprosula]